MVRLQILSVKYKFEPSFSMPGQKSSMIFSVNRQLLFLMEIRRRFMSLAGMMEIADREFQAIQDADKALAKEARSRVEEGQLGRVEITPDALKAFLDKKIRSRWPTF